MKVNLVVLGLMGLMLSACSSHEDTHPGQPVTHRKAIFKEMLRSFEPMGLVARGRNPYNQAEFLKYAQELQQLGTQPWQYFTPDSNYDPSRASLKCGINLWNLSRRNSILWMQQRN